MFTIQDNEFHNGDKPTGVAAKRSRGRWQYRMVEDGKLVASGMTPEKFVAEFWFGEFREGGSE